MSNFKRMLQRGQISAQQYEQGRRYEAAHKAVSSDGRPASDLLADRILRARHGRLPASVSGHEFLDRALVLLGIIDNSIVKAVVVDGRSLAETAARLPMYRGKCGVGEVRCIGQRFRFALHVLAELGDQ